MATDIPPMPADQHLQLLHALSQAFRPAAPIDRRDLFAGRTAQVNDIFSVASQPGLHGVIYGERGVGKTSLATVASDILGASVISARANCDTGDDFSSIWRKVLDAIEVRVATPAFGFGNEMREVAATAARFLDGVTEPGPNDVRRVMQTLSAYAPVTVFIDEFDRLQSNGAQTLFADTIKTLSDQLVNASIILVGVADNVNELITEHESIERALAQIHMPRMSSTELAEIVTRGLDSVGMTVEDEVVRRITHLSQGLPHYTHLLAQLAAQAAVMEGRLDVAVDDVRTAVNRAISKAQQSIMDAYHRATLSTRRTLYPQVVLACALAEGDDFGFFAAADVREPLTRIMGQPYDIPAFAQHLNELSSPLRGPVLQKKGATRRVRYRFINPLLQPYVVMKGLSEGLIDPQWLSGS
jgi:Cdc6-like AAA superfamily ATPase